MEDGHDVVAVAALVGRFVGLEDVVEAEESGGAGPEAVLAARRLVEVGLGRDCRKQYWVVAPLVA